MKKKEKTKYQNKTKCFTITKTTRLVYRFLKEYWDEEKLFKMMKFQEYLFYDVVEYVENIPLKCSWKSSIQN